MTPKLWIAMASFIVSMICLWTANLAIWKMREQVNQRLPQSDQMDYLFWTFGRRHRLFQIYRRTYPDGPLAKRVIVYGIAMALLLLVCFYSIAVH